MAASDQVGRRGRQDGGRPVTAVDRLDDRDGSGNPVHWNIRPEVLLLLFDRVTESLLRIHSTASPRHPSSWTNGVAIMAISECRRAPAQGLPDILRLVDQQDYEVVSAGLLDCLHAGCDLVGDDLHGVRGEAGLDDRLIE